MDLRAVSVDRICGLKVSSVLNNDVASFGKQHLMDGNDQTCWNSEQGSPQFILLKFSESIHIRQIALMFQGGFVGKTVEFWTSSPNQQKLDRRQIFEPKDQNDMQVFDVDILDCEKLKVVFPSSTDFYGRITLYNLEVRELV